MLDWLKKKTQKKEKKTKMLLIKEWTGAKKRITNPEKFAKWRELCKSEGLSGYTPILIEEVKE